MRQIVLVIHNIRSAHNVGSLLRTADGLGVEKAIISGYSPYPTMNKDERLPHIAERVNFQIHKTALGAENSVNWRRIDDLKAELAQLRQAGYILCALEQLDGAVSLNQYKPSEKIALVLGNEVSGVDDQLVGMMDVCLEIPMRGQKESFNVAVAGAIALYHLTTA